MIRYKNPGTGAEIISSNDGAHESSKGPRDRQDEVIRTSDIERLPDGKFRKKGGQVEEHK